MKIIDLYQMGALPQTSHIPVINAGMGHFSYTAMSMLPYDRREDALQEDKKNIIKQRQRYEKYRKENNIPLLDATSTREEKTDEKQIYHMTGMDAVASMSDLKKIYKGGVRIFQPRREESNARGESYRSDVGGLKQRGIQAIQRLASQTAIIDCTNAHTISIIELLEIYHKPVILRSSSRSLHASVYNYEDDLIERILDQ